MDHLRPLLLLFFLAIAAAELTQDKAALLSFFSQSPHASRLQWNASSSACDWVGVTCDPNRTAVVALRLPGVGLLGPIAPNTLSRLSSLRVLSLRSNRLSGPIPTDLTSLSALRHLYLQNNLFSGEIPPELARLNQLVRLDISENRFSGEIPFGLNNLTRLTGLFLQNNSFSGSLPSIALGNLTAFDVSYNQLNGSIPRTLERFPPSSFAGNLGLCGGPLPPCSRPFFPPAPSPTGDEGKTLPKSKKRKLSTAAIIAIAVGAGVLFLLLLLLLFCIAFRRRRRAAAAGDGEGKAAKSSGSVPRSATTSGMTVSSSSMGLEAAAKNKLVFIDRGVYTFDLEDLLRASAEVLGKGTMGTSYKAVLEDGTTVVVKRLKDVMLQKKEFELQLESLGKARHANVVPLRAYYYSKDEKLLVYDYVPSGSLSAALHGSRGSGRPPVDWDTRLGISLAAARGLAYLHLEAKVVHGDVKASNVLVRVGPDAAAVSDFGLWPLFGGVAPAGGRGAGYRAPEVQETRRPTAKSDVYSFGVVLLELLTGRSPTSVGEDAIDLPRWVQSVVREEWTAEVFDAELARYGGGDVGAEEEMVELLQVAMACCGLAPDRRPGMDEVVRTVEGIAERAAERGGGRLKPSSSSDAAASKGGESRGPTPPAAPTP